MENNQIQSDSNKVVQGNMGKLLLDSGKLRLEDAEKILRLQKTEGLRFGEAAVKLGLVTEEDIRNVLSKQFDYHSLPPGSDEIDSKVVAAFNPLDPVVEALRVLRSQLVLRWFSDHRSIVVASARSNSGTSVIAANLAVVFSQLGQKTLLIDADMRHPRQHEIFRLRNQVGLSSVLAGRAGIESIQEVKALENLSVLVAGSVPPNPLELLGRSALGELMARLELEYDVIIIDASPAMDSGDALALSALVGGALLVAKRHISKMSDIENFKQQINVAGAQIVGSVMNEFC